MIQSWMRSGNTLAFLNLWEKENNPDYCEEGYKELLAKKNKGLNVRIIVSQEDTNNAMIATLKSEGFDVKVIPRWGAKGYNRMHDKFCIIDMDYVMHGSYNWTPTANYNEETLATALDHELVSKFAEEFMKLYNE